jgi:hypothetical protein
MGTLMDSAAFDANKQLVEVLARGLGVDQTATPSIRKQSATPALMLEAAIANDVFYPIYNWLKRESLRDKTLKGRYERLFYQYVTGQSIQQAEAANLLRTFKEKGLEVMPLKGLFLSTQYYKDPLMRYSRDWDFLFKSKTDRFFAEKALVKAGYHVSFALPLQTTFSKRISRFSAHCETHSVPISLTLSFGYPLWYDLWSRSRSAQLMGSPAHLMQPEDAFMVLCAHALTKGLLSMRDLMDFIVILREFDSSSWNHLKRLSEAPIWRYIIAVPLVIYSTIGEILLSRELVPKEMVRFFATDTSIRIEDSRKLVGFLLREHGMPIDLRYVMRYFGYSGTPLFEVYLLWNEGRELTFFGIIKTIFLEGCQSLALARSELNQGYAKNCVQSYLSTYILRYFRRYRAGAA